MIGRVMILLVRAYQVCLSSWLPSSCIYRPTCSNYMIQAVRRHGWWRGGWMGLRRILRCHPFAEGGYDPVPGTETTPADSSAPNEDES